MDESYNSAAFGPSPFLLSFEQLCIIVPAVVLISQVPFSINNALYNCPRVQSSRIIWLKLAIVGALNAVQLSIVFRWLETSPPERTLARAAATTSYVGMLSLGLLTVLDNWYSAHPEAFLSVFLATTLLLDVSLFPSYFHPKEFGATNPHLTFLLLKCSLLILEQVPKRFVADEENSSELNNESGHVLQNMSLVLQNMPLWKWTKLYLAFGFRSQVDIGHPSASDKEARPDALYREFLSQWEQGGHHCVWSLPLLIS